MADRRGFIGVLTGMAAAILGRRAHATDTLPTIPAPTLVPPELSVSAEGPNPANVIRDILVRAGLDVDHASFDEMARYYDEEVGGSVAPLEPLVPQTPMISMEEEMQRALQQLPESGNALIVDRGVMRLGPSDFETRIYSD